MDILAIKQIQQGIGGIRDVLIALKEKVFIDLFSKYMKKIFRRRFQKSDID